jgi:hypothetical protein
MTLAVVFMILSSIIILTPETASHLKTVPMADMVMSVAIPNCNGIVFKIDALLSISYTNLCTELFATSDGSESLTSSPTNLRQLTLQLAY